MNNESDIVWKIDDNDKNTVYTNIGKECIFLVKKVDDGIELRTTQKQKDGQSYIVFSKFIGNTQIC